MDLRIEPGEVQLSEPGIELVVDEPTCKIWHVDLATKYARVLGYNVGDAGRLSVLLFAGERTININPLKTGVPTELVVEGVEGEWIILAEVIRYTCRIVIYQDLRPRGDEEA